MDKGEWKVEWKTDDLYTIILKIYYTFYTIKLKIFAQRFYYSSSKFSKFSHSVALWKPLSRRSKRWPSLTFWYTVHPSSNSKQLMLSGISLLTVLNVDNPVGLVGLPYVMWSAHFFVTHIQTENISSWNGPTVHVCCFMLACASTKTFVSRVRKTAKKIFVSRKIR